MHIICVGATHSLYYHSVYLSDYIVSKRSGVVVFKNMSDLTASLFIKLDISILAQAYFLGNEQLTVRTSRT